MIPNISLSFPNNPIRQNSIQFPDPAEYGPSRQMHKSKLSKPTPRGNTEYGSAPLWLSLSNISPIIKLLLFSFVGIRATTGIRSWGGLVQGARCPAILERAVPQHILLPVVKGPAAEADNGSIFMLKSRPECLGAQRSTFVSLGLSTRVGSTVFSTGGFNLREIDGRSLPACFSRNTTGSSQVAQCSAHGGLLGKHAFDCHRSTSCRNACQDPCRTCKCSSSW